MASADDSTPRGAGVGPRIGLGAGLFAFALLLLMPLWPDQPAASRTAAAAALLAIWWMTEAIPIPATALLPIVLLPLLGVLSPQAVAERYFSDTIALFLGGFLLALGLERWGLHRRIAFVLLERIGGTPRRLVLGFLLTSTFLSMWISNTATAMMLTPLALAVIGEVESLHPGIDLKRFGVLLLLTVAYGSSIGGIGSLIGSPPNGVYVGVLASAFPEAPAVSFFDWMKVCVPFVLVFGAGLAGLLLLVLPSGLASVEPRVLAARREALGPMDRAEASMLALFGLTAFLWVFRQDIDLGALTLPGWGRWLPDGARVSDATVAIFMAILGFVLPGRASDPERRRLLDWSMVHRLPWGILILFGGGFALAHAFEVSLLSAELGRFLGAVVHGWQPLAMILAVCLLVTFMTEVTSNTATATVLLPLLATTAIELGHDPRLLMLPAALSASCAFMLPVATPPNAIVFGSNRITIGQMMRYGLVLNLIGAVLITLFVRYLAVPWMGIEVGSVPDWAK